VYYGELGKSIIIRTSEDIQNILHVIHF